MLTFLYFSLLSIAKHQYKSSTMKGYTIKGHFSEAVNKSWRDLLQLLVSIIAGKPNNLEEEGEEESEDSFISISEYLYLYVYYFHFLSDVFCPSEFIIIIVIKLTFINKFQQ